MKRLVGHWMARSVLTAEPDEPVYTAIELMAERRLRHVLIKDGDEVLGIVSNRDIVRAALIHPERKLDLHSCTLRDIMTPGPLVETTAEATLGEASKLMFDHKVSALPVNEGGRLQGIITSEDVLAAMSLGEQPTKRPDL